VPANRLPIITVWAPAAIALAHVARVLDAAVGDQQRVGSGQRLGAVVDGGDLRDADAGDDAGGADRARTDAHLDRVGARLGKRQRPSPVATFAGDELRLREVAAHVRDRLEHALRVTVGGVDADDVAARLEQGVDPLVAIGADADRRADRSRPKSSLAACGCCWAFSMSLIVISPFR
jgi:hypothetical protein